MWSSPHSAVRWTTHAFGVQPSGLIHLRWQMSKSKVNLGTPDVFASMDYTYFIGPSKDPGMFEIKNILTCDKINS